MAISSNSLLSSTPATYVPLFSSQPIVDTIFFDEGPRVPNAKSLVASSMSGSLVTTAIDPFTQGVEMTRQTMYDAGLVKIWSGEAGHRLLVTNFGMDTNTFPNPEFADLDLFDPLTFITEQENVSPLYSNVFSYPIVTSDANQADNYNFNGVIEPLTIRPIMSFFSTEAPFESHTIKGTFSGGNADQFMGSDQVLTVDYFAPNREIVGFLDMIDMVENMPTSGYFRFEFATLLPYDDARLVRNVPATHAEPNVLLAALSLMTGSTDNYISAKQRSATCGWYYDNNAGVGTDSLAFGGMTH